MPTIDRTPDQEWQNYHATRQFVVAESYRFVGDAAPHPDGPSRFKETAHTIMAHLADLRGSANAGIIGSAWSLSELLGCTARQLDTTELDGFSWVEAPHLHHRSRLKPREAVFVNGGMTWKGLVDNIERDKQSPRSIFTCGSYLAQSIAGSVGTSTGGSRLGYGGVQNQVRGMHLVTGAKSSVWIEKRNDPILGHVAADFADTIIRDDDVFEDALVHLGGMGVVNGLVLETAPLDRFTMLKVQKDVDAVWLERVRDGKFDAIAAWLGFNVAPAYYEIQIDPFGWDSSPAIHTMYFPTQDVTAPLLPTPNVPVAELLGSLAKQLATLPWAPRGIAAPGFVVDCGDVSQALADLFKFYSGCLMRPTTPEDSGAQTWGKLHDVPPAPEEKALIYTAAFAFSRHDIVRALLTACAAVAGRPRQFLYTLRFISDGAGSMAFAHYPESVVLDFEGLKVSPQVAADSRRSLDLAQAALQDAGIRFSPHWGKLGNIDAAGIEREFGPSTEGTSRLARWMQTRLDLLTSDGERLLWNDALVKWRLI